MKKIVLFAVSAMFIGSICLAEDAAVKRRVIYNNDGSNIFMASENVSADDVRKTVDCVVGTQVDTYMISPAAMVSYFPSKTVEWLGDGRPESGSPQFPVLARNVKRLVDAGHDPIGLVIDRAKEKGFETFITYRMNDVHDTDLPDSMLFSSFWKTHPEWRVGSGAWNDAALNYAVPEVREHTFARLKEVLDRYGDRIDGLELDWHRFPSYFKKGEAEKNIPTLTQFLRDVRCMTDDLGKRRGRPLLLSVRVPGTLEQSHNVGLDPVGWAKEQLVDFATVAPFLYMDVDTVAVGEYKKAITNVPVYACIEASYSKTPRSLEPEDYRKEAKKLWLDGADGIYLFNYFGFLKGAKSAEYTTLINEIGDLRGIAGEIPHEQKMATILEVRALAKSRYSGWPSVGIAPNGDLIAVFSGDRSGHVSPDGKTQMVRSNDGGKTWSEVITIQDLPVDDRDAGVMQTAKGTVIVSWFTGPPYHTEHQGAYVARSSDNGLTWSKPIRTNVSAPHGPAQLSDGRLLYIGQQPHCSHAKPGDYNGPPADSPYKVALDESSDDGQTWKILSTFPVPADGKMLSFDEPSLVEAEPGRIVAMFRDCNPPDCLWQSESADGGRTWTAPQRTKLQGHPPHLLKLKNGWILVVYAKRQQGPAQGQYACISCDGGRTWDVENEIRLARSFEGDMGYPGSAQLPDGSIWTVFYQAEKPGETPCLMGTHWRLKE